MVLVVLGIVDSGNMIIFFGIKALSGVPFFIPIFNFKGGQTT